VQELSFHEYHIHGFSEVTGGHRSHVQELQFLEFKKLVGSEGHHCPQVACTLQWPLLNVIHIPRGTEDIGQVRTDE
jgi:hypothetical protein